MRGTVQLISEAAIAHPPLGSSRPAAQCLKVEGATGSIEFHYCHWSMAEVRESEYLADTIDGTFLVSFKSEECQEAVTLSVPQMSTIGEVILIASTHFQTEFNAISLFGEELDVNDSFADYFEPD